MRSILGTASRREATSPPKDAGNLAEVVVKDLEGQDVQLRELWREQPAVLVFLRHYG